jgi:hypothetical protein
VASQSYSRLCLGKASNEKARFFVSGRPAPPYHRGGHGPPSRFTFDALQGGEKRDLPPTASYGASRHQMAQPCDSRFGRAGCQMSARLLVELHRVQDSLPLALSTIYSQTSRGNWNWATRIGPDGRRGRRLWVDVDALEAWMRIRGWQHTLRRTSKVTRR